MSPHNWLFAGACGLVAFAFLFRVACRALDQLDGKGPLP